MVTDVGVRSVNSNRRHRPRPVRARSDQRFKNTECFLLQHPCSQTTLLLGIWLQPTVRSGSLKTCKRAEDHDELNCEINRERHSVTVTKIRRNRMFHDFRMKHFYLLVQQLHMTTKEDMKKKVEKKKVEGPSLRNRGWFSSCNKTDRLQRDLIKENMKRRREKAVSSLLKTGLFNTCKHINLTETGPAPGLNPPAWKHSWSQLLCSGSKLPSFCIF